MYAKKLFKKLLNIFTLWLKQDTSLHVEFFGPIHLFLWLAMYRISYPILGTTAVNGTALQGMLHNHGVDICFELIKN